MNRKRPCSNKNTDNSKFYRQYCLFSRDKQWPAAIPQSQRPLGHQFVTRHPNCQVKLTGVYLCPVRWICSLGGSGYHRQKGAALGLSPVAVVSSQACPLPFHNASVYLCQIRVCRRETSDCHQLVCTWQPLQTECHPWTPSRRTSQHVSQLQRDNTGAHSQHCAPAGSPSPVGGAPQAGTARSRSCFFL